MLAYGLVSMMLAIILLGCLSVNLFALYTVFACRSVGRTASIREHCRRNRVDYIRLQLRFGRLLQQHIGFYR